MGLPQARSPHRVPRRLPVGAKYVVEGYGGEGGDLRVTARYLVLPDGARINVPPDLPRRPASPRARSLHRNSPSKHAQGKSRWQDVGQKFVARRGTSQRLPR
jgi:hypothetical protein